ncbi:hypothetical protein KKF84_01920 [Myxococcota bacterium]|nr:hypothetical protein [Myxococcota bacterium]
MTIVSTAVIIVAWIFIEKARAKVKAKAEAKAAEALFIANLAAAIEERDAIERLMASYPMLASLDGRCFRNEGKGPRYQERQVIQPRDEREFRDWDSQNCSIHGDGEGNSIC